MKLRTQLLATSVGPIVVALALQTGFSLSRERHALGDGLSEKARSVSSVMVAVVGPNILFKDAGATKDGLKSVEADGDFRAAIAVDETGNALSSIGEAGLVTAIGKVTLPKETTVEHRAGATVAIAPVRSGGKTVGAVVVALSEAKVDAAEREAMIAAAAVTLVMALLASLLAAYFGRKIVGAIDATASVLQAVAEGDLTRRLDHLSDDEIGAMGASLNHTMERLGDALRNVATSVETLGNSSTTLTALSTRLGDTASNTSAQASSAVTAAETVSANAGAVAAASEEMGVSVKEIARNAGEAAHVAKEAVTSAESTSENIQHLDASSREIGNVVKLITAIAEQTNLLALNATIEAARAGEAGKGFAVVATEVKELAKQTSKATEEISTKVTQIQSDSRTAVEAIKHIRSVIGQVHDHQTAIAGAVEEQAATTKEIGSTIQGAATASAAIVSTITQVAASAQSTNEASEESREAAKGLEVIASELKQVLSHFRFTAKGGQGDARPASAPVAPLPAYTDRPYARA
jgi:methyl-accepting chemotaxis protein